MLWWEVGLGGGGEEVGMSCFLLSTLGSGLGVVQVVRTAFEINWTNIFWSCHRYYGKHSTCLGQAPLTSCLAPCHLEKLGALAGGDVAGRESHPARTGSPAGWPGNSCARCTAWPRTHVLPPAFHSETQNTLSGGNDAGARRLLHGLPEPRDSQWPSDQQHQRDLGSWWEMQTHRPLRGPMEAEPAFTPRWLIFPATQLSLRSPGFSEPPKLPVGLDEQGFSLLILQSTMFALS